MLEKSLPRGTAVPAAIPVFTVFLVFMAVPVVALVSAMPISIVTVVLRNLSVAGDCISAN
jgi:hypothetical protein